LNPDVRIIIIQAANESSVDATDTTDAIDDEETYLPKISSTMDRYNLI